jgi:uncharacterized protein YjaZ
MKNFLLIISILFVATLFGQNSFETNPSKAEFITTDIPNFWKAFDKMDTNSNPFEEYLESGSEGLKDFIPYRIESAKNLLKIAKKRKADYEIIRENSYHVELYTKLILTFYQALKNMYELAVFPPAYFVIGAFNSGGTSSENGLIMGVEMQNKIENIPYIVAHELIHFNQNYSNNKNTLLEQSIKEGSADFIGELISGKHINEIAFEYGDENEEQLCSEFVEIMSNSKYHGWLYGSKGKKKGRPNDLGYWIGYKICESYFNKSNNQQDAIDEILNIKDFDKFLKKSGYLSKYINK